MAGMSCFNSYLLHDKSIIRICRIVNRIRKKKVVKKKLFLRLID